MIKHKVVLVPFAIRRELGVLSPVMQAQVGTALRELFGLTEVASRPNETQAEKKT